MEGCVGGLKRRPARWTEPFGILTEDMMEILEAGLRMMSVKG